MHTPRAARVFSLWLPFLIASSGIFLFAYWAVQQEYRMSVNDPQVQMAEDAALRLAQGEAPASLVTSQSVVDIRQSLAPWVAIYDASGTPITGTASLDEAPAQLPTGVFDESSWHKYAEMGVPFGLPTHEDRFSWQPRPDVRQAVVLEYVSSPAFTGYVAAGRNMRETESRISTFTEGAAILWGSTELATLLGILLVSAII